MGASLFRSAPDSIGAGIVSTAAGSVDAELVAASFVLSGWILGDDLGATALVAGHHPVEILVFSGVGVDVGRSIQIGCQLLAEARAAVDTQRTPGVEKVAVVEVVVVRSLHCVPANLYRRPLPSIGHCRRSGGPVYDWTGGIVAVNLRAFRLVAGNHPVEVFAYTGVGVEVSGTNNIGCQLLAETGAAVCTQRTAGVEKVVVVEVVVVRSLHSIPTDPYRRSLYGVMQV